MALQFQPPNVKSKEDKNREAFQQILGAAQTIPALWMQYKAQRMQSEMQNKELEFKKRQLESQYGTGAPAPLQPGALTPQPGLEGGGPEEALFGLDATAPKNAAETPEEQLRRIGAEGYKALNPVNRPTYFFDPVKKQTLDPAGNVVTNIPAEAQIKVLQAPTTIMDASGKVVGTAPGRTGILPKPDASETKNIASANEMDSLASDIIQELERIEPLNEKSRGGFFGGMAQRAESAADRDKPSDKFKNTAEVINALKGMVSRILKSTFGGQLSDSERDYLNEVYGASEKMSRTERAIAIKNVKKLMISKRDAANRKAGLDGAEAGAPGESSAQEDPLGVRD